MTIQKKSLISTLNTTKKAIVASSPAGPCPQRPRLRALPTAIAPSRDAAKPCAANRAAANALLPTVLRQPRLRQAVHAAKRDAANRAAAKPCMPPTEVPVSR